MTNRRELKRLSAVLSVSVIYVMQAPELPKAVQQITVIQEQDETGRLSVVSRDTWQRRRQAFDDRLRASVKESSIFVETTDLFCDESYCYAGENGNSFYYDNDHPSLTGARMVARRVLPYIMAKGR